jgi:hypothetical protein
VFCNITELKKKLPDISDVVLKNPTSLWNFRSV